MRPQLISFQHWNTSFNTVSSGKKLLVLLLLLLLQLSSWLLVWRRTLHLLKHSLSASFIAWLDQAAEFPPCRHPSLISQCCTGPDSAPWRLNGLKKNQIPYILFCSLVESDSRFSELHCSKKKHVHIIYAKKGAFHRYNKAFI